MSHCHIGDGALPPSLPLAQDFGKGAQQRQGPLRPEPEPGNAQGLSGPSWAPSVQHHLREGGALVHGLMIIIL